MAKFVTKRVESIRAINSVEQLVVNGVEQLGVFEKSIVGTTYQSEYETTIRYIEHAANGNELPDTKFKFLKGVTDGTKEFEFKSKHLRIYGIQPTNRKLIIMGGFKNNQEGDISKFRALKKQYLESVKAKK